MMKQENSRQPHPSQVAWAFAVTYSLLIIYGTLYPFQGWQFEQANAWKFLNLTWPQNTSRADFISNLLVYAPLGLALGWALLRRVPSLVAVSVATASGTLLSMLLEALQGFLPQRTPSLLDVFANGASTLVGALLAVMLTGRTSFGRAILTLRKEWLRSGRLANIGLAVLGLWALSQLSPLVPSLDVGNLRHGLKPLWQTAHHLGLFDVPQTVVYALDILGLTLLGSTIVRPERSARRFILIFVATVLLLKVPIVSRQISLEALAGATMGFAVFAVLSRRSPALIAAGAALAVLAGFVIDGLRPETTASARQMLQPLNLIPFRNHMTNIVGLADILSNSWSFLALAYLAHRVWYPLKKGTVVGGSIFIFVLSLVIELVQRGIPGRSPDITDVFIAVLAWILPWWILKGRKAEQPIRAERSPSGARGTAAPSFGKGRWAAVGAGVLLLGMSSGFVGWLMLGGNAETALDESKLPRLPSPRDLPPVTLPDFRYHHPRLPAPTQDDIRRLMLENPTYLRRLERNVKHNRGGLYPAILLAKIQPGSQDLQQLHARLMALQFKYRGHEQGKPLAVAYDWLYDQWSEKQLAQLREKLVESCDYLINRIRKTRLSLYNVYFYNSPFQALMACALALYGDDPRGDLAMRFTYDLWKNRVLPVWRQIMGRNGGWHEGGEYVGIGIGQAIYQVPAMWRKATGEDLFLAEPGIRGFLDFLIFRTRPDGTCFRWGDAGFFNRYVPDRIPLALEYRHTAAYSLGRRPKRTEPTSWPWGPLPDAALDWLLYDPEAVSGLPLSRYFDGIGLLVARSDWSPRATYVSFKAGDNYWSHSHLDQGAFTIFKGGPLAIDSGLYGPKYGSDHHMNHTYQTIAHNTITVKDPDDCIPAPGKKKPRAIANDGGQRRIGSGWGVEAAPLDLMEWEAKKDIYHTGRMERVFQSDDLVVGVADITSAYTNRQSGKGTFSHRTRRVEQCWRTFAYDRVEDVIILLDRVKATSAEFTKRWLLHTIEPPERTPYGFLVSVAPKAGASRTGGRLEGHVLLPKRAKIGIVGGKEAAFLVDGLNYDGNGAVGKKAKNRKNAEIGEWRVEVLPSREAKQDVFLVVFLPNLMNEQQTHEVNLLQEGNHKGCEILGSYRTTRWWYEPELNGVKVEIIQGGTIRTHDITCAPSERLPQLGMFRSLIGWLRHSLSSQP